MKISIPLLDREVNFQLYPIDTKFSRISAIYAFFVFPEQSPIQVPQFYNLLYVGIATNLYSRLQTHNNMKRAKELGMTHLGVLKMSSGRKRKTTEKAILKHYNPALNKTFL